MGGRDLSGERLKQARSLFESALEMPLEQRSGFLSEQCGDDTELRRFVERLLESHASGEGSFLEPPAESGVRSRDLTVQTPLSGPRIGTRIGPYEITDKLGEGGMGTVWKGWDSLLQRPVAIKFVSERLGTSEQAHQRFLREARSASKLSHQGIATVHSAGEHEGQVYIVFRLIDGETVAERVKRGPLEVSEALRLARESAEALGHAHEAGVLHRDVTSRNLMVDKDGSAVIVDFGLALPEADPRITKTGSTFGTLGYMAPEVVQGKRHDRRSDLYGLGVVLYEMLTGSLPFEGERAESLLYAIVNETVEAPSERRKDLPKDVDRVLLKVLAKDPEVRYQTTEELAADVRRLEAGLAPEADVSPARSGTRLWAESEGKGQGKHAPPSPLPLPRWILISIATVVIALLGYIAWRARPHSAPEHIKVAVLPLENDSAQPEASDYMAIGLGETLATKLTRVSSLQVTPWITSRGYRPMQPLALPDIADELDVHQLIIGTFRHEGDRLQIRLSLVDGNNGMNTWADEFLGRDDELLDISERIAAAVATRLRGELDPDESKALARNPTENEDAYKLYLQGATYLQEGTKIATNLALSFFEKAVALDPNLAEAHVGIGAVHSSRYWFAWGGRQDLELAEASYRTALVLDPKLWPAHRGLIRAAWYRGRSEECLRIGALAERAGAEDIGALLARAEASHFGGLSDLSIPPLERIIQLDPMNEAAHWFLPMVSAYAGRYEGTIEAAEEYLRRFGEDDEVLTWLGVAHQSLGEVGAARLAYRGAMEIRGDNPNSYAPLFGGLLEEEAGHPEDARRIWSGALAEYEDRLEEFPDNGPMAAMHAILSELIGDRDGPSGIQMPALGTVPVEYLMELAMAHAHRGRNEDALRLFRQLVDSGSIARMDFLFTWKMFAGLRSEPGYEDYVQDRRALEDHLRSRYQPSADTALPTP